MQSFMTKPYHAHEIIFKEGSSGSMAYILKEGSVEISVKADDKKTVLAVLKPVSVFGEMAILLNEHRRIATATALEYAELVEVSRENFEKFIDSSPTFIKTILSALAERLRHADSKITRIPDLYVATCQILNLLLQNGNSDIPCDSVLAALADALSVDHRLIQEQLYKLERVSLIQIRNNARNRKIIRVLKIPFLPEAMKYRDLNVNFNEIPD